MAGVARRSVAGNQPAKESHCRVLSAVKATKPMAAKARGPVDASGARQVVGAPAWKLFDHSVLDVSDVGTCGRAYLLDRKIANVLEEARTATEKNRRDVKIKLIDKAGS